jgi:hypothetical protein
MRKSLPLAVGVAALSAIAGSASASAASDPVLCATTADVVSGSIYDLSEGTYDSATGLTLPPETSTTLERNRMFATTTATRLRFGGFTYRLKAETIVALACSGAAGAPADDPMLVVKMGSASVRTGGRSHKGSISSDEMLLDPYANRRMRFSLTRVPTGDPTLAEVLAPGGPETLRFATVKARRTSRHGYLNVTPYIGSENRTNGLCHQSRRVKIVSTDYKGGYLNGSVSYRSLAPFSPR